MAIVVEGSYSGTPSTNTFSALKTQVARYVLMPNDDEGIAVAGEAINDAILEVNVANWYWSLTTEDVTLVADDADYTLGATFNTPRALEFLDSSDLPTRGCGFEDWKTFLIMHPKRNISGTPTVYTLRNVHGDGLLQFDHPIGSSFLASYPTARVHFYKRISVLEADTDVPDVPSEVELYIKWSAKRYMASIYDPAKYGMADTQANKTWNALRRKNTTESDSDWNEG